MGILGKLKSKRSAYVQSKSEARAFKKIVNKRALQARRKAYEEEAVKVARQKGKALARNPKPSFGSQIVSVIERAAAPKPRPTRTIRRTTRKPARRSVRKASRPQQARFPSTLSEAIYGGY